MVHAVGKHNQTPILLYIYKYLKQMRKGGESTVSNQVKQTDGQWIRW